MDSIIGFNANDITSIDFDIALNQHCFAQTTLQVATPRCKVYYCFKNDDTREDGEDRCPQSTYAEICECFIKYLTTSASHSNRPAITCNIALYTSTEKRSFNENDISTETLKKLINLLSEKIDEFTFLSAFKYHI